MGQVGKLHGVMGHGVGMGFGMGVYGGGLLYPFFSGF